MGRARAGPAVLCAGLWAHWGGPLLPPQDLARVQPPGWEDKGHLGPIRSPPHFLWSQLQGHTEALRSASRKERASWALFCPPRPLAAPLPLGETARESWAGWTGGRALSCPASGAESKGWTELPSGVRGHGGWGQQVEVRDQREVEGPTRAGKDRAEGSGYRGGGGLASRVGRLLEGASLPSPTHRLWAGAPGARWWQLRQAGSERQAPGRRAGRGGPGQARMTGLQALPRCLGVGCGASLALCCSRHLSRPPFPCAICPGCTHPCLARISESVSVTVCVRSCSFCLSAPSPSLCAPSSLWALGLSLLPTLSLWLHGSGLPSILSPPAPTLSPGSPSWPWPLPSRALPSPFQRWGETGASGGGAAARRRGRTAGEGGRSGPVQPRPRKGRRALCRCPKPQGSSGSSVSDASSLCAPPPSRASDAGHLVQVQLCTYSLLRCLGLMTSSPAATSASSSVNPGTVPTSPSLCSQISSLDLSLLCP